MNPLLSIENLKVAYPQSRSLQQGTSWAIDDVTLKLEPGDRLGLVGESGCGKSTLGRAVMSLLPPSSRIEGRIDFGGKSVFEMNSADMRKFRGESVALVFQDPMTRLDPLMTIGRHCIETLQAHDPKLSAKDAKAKAIATLDAVSIPESRWKQYPHEFSGGMRQRVALALALLIDPKLIVADEPTTSLDVTTAAQILKELKRLCEERSMALLLISHDLALVKRYCDRVGVMKQGKLVELNDSKSVLHNPQHEYTQSLVQAALDLHAGGHLDRGNKKKAQSLLLKITNLQQYYKIEPDLVARLFQEKEQTIKAVDDVSLELYSGEILGLVGESGCGKSTLSRTILQLVRPTEGKVQLQGTELTTLSRQNLLQQRRQMQMVFQDPHACLNPVMTVGENIADPVLIHKLETPKSSAKQQVIEMLERVGLVPAEDYYERYPSQLSGGQQQRVAIARAVITHPKLLICDEPVSMLDANIQAQVLELMLELKQNFDLTYLFITHDLVVARFLCDRIAVMKAGQIVEIGTKEDIFTNPQHSYTKELLAAAFLLAPEEFKEESKE
jgi:peptide/nickel transport system ATP-binding protein